jgi:beta-phosphoglucomutase-like phosphatase (HAD superfamily)
VFDTDGVLTDTAGVHATAWKRLFDEYLQRRAARLGEPFRPFEEADYLRDHGARPFPTSLAFVRQLRERGLRTAVVSASRNMVAVLDSAGLGGLFDVEVDGGEADRLGLAGKPDPALFLEAARRLGWHRAGPRWSRTPWPSGAPTWSWPTWAS